MASSDIWSASQMLGDDLEEFRRLSERTRKRRAMIYGFDSFELDLGKIELRHDGVVVPVEPQVFALLRYLVEHHDRMVSKDEIIAAIWHGRVVSDSAIASRVKSARQALGDDGKSQRLIRTIHGLGFRFVAPVATSGAKAFAAPRTPDEPAPRQPQSATTRPSIAVLPFDLIGDAGPHAVIAEALPDEIITQLCRLRWLFVIARGSSFRFRGAGGDLADIRAALNVRYCLSGAVEVHGKSLVVSVELSDTQDNGVLWAERFQTQLDAVHEIREAITRATITALELQIPLNEARAARMKPPEHLDAWSAYHLALQHMYRFTKDDNAAATHLLNRAVALEPNFARAYAGLSFTHFQDAFLSYVPDVAGARTSARRYAEQSLEHDPLDPFSNFTMGRSFFLTGDLEGSLAWLERANTLNPNYAQGKYSSSWAETILGRGLDGRANADAALALSPLDPFRYAMLACRSFSHVVLYEPAEAAQWADQAARSPGAHVLIKMIAVAAHSLNADDERAGSWAQVVRNRRPDVTRSDFFRAFPFRDAETIDRVARALERHGF